MNRTKHGLFFDVAKGDRRNAIYIQQCYLYFCGKSTTRNSFEILISQNRVYFSSKIQQKLVQVFQI